MYRSNGDREIGEGQYLTYLAQATGEGADILPAGRIEICPGKLAGSAAKVSDPDGGIRQDR